jgi:hypothetical protein
MDYREPDWLANGADTCHGGDDPGYEFVVGEDVKVISEKWGEVVGEVEHIIEPNSDPPVFVVRFFVRGLNAYVSEDFFLEDMERAE